MIKPKKGLYVVTQEKKDETGKTQLLDSANSAA